MKRTIHQITCLFVSALLFAAPVAFAADAPAEKDMITSAKAVLVPTQGNSTAGVVNFTRVKGGIKVVAEITGLTPGEHGFHVHEWGDCSSPDATSAGSHFNPSHEPHGGPDSAHHHAGDFGNVVADASGKASFELLDNKISFAGPNSILGRGIIVHQKKDDLHSQPVGDAGARLACGIVAVVKP
jgi:Cu-Zn family superoxide dismutase